DTMINKRSQTFQSMWEQRVWTKSRQVPRAFFSFHNHDNVATGQRCVKVQIPGSNYLISFLIKQLSEVSNEFSGKIVWAQCAILFHSAVYSKYLFVGRD